MSMPKIAVIIHAFYEEMWPEISRHVHSFDAYDCDLLVTIPLGASVSFEQSIRSEYHQANIQRIANRGFDVGPFIDVLGRIDLDAYDYVVKLHTKRNRFGIVNYLPLFGGEWRRKLLSFCDTARDVQNCISIFEGDQSVGMIGHGELILHPWDAIVPNPPPKDPSDPRAFIGGTMFIARAAVFRRIDQRISFNDFDETSRDQTSSLAHEWERKLGHLVSEAGLRLVGYPSASWRFRLLKPLGRLAYRVLRATR